MVVAPALPQGLAQHAAAHECGDGFVALGITAVAYGTTELWADPVFAYVQVFTPPDLVGRGRAVAVEPMTCPPDAFRAVEPPEEIQMPPRAAELAVGDGLQPDLLLLLDDALDLAPVWKRRLMKDFNRKVEDASARVNKSVAEAADRMEKETAEFIAYLNDEVVPAVRQHSTKALRVAAEKMSKLADYLDEVKAARR